MMSEEQGETPRVDLSASSLLVRYLQCQGGPLSAEQRDWAVALQKQLCAAPWTSAEERNWAQVLVLRLEMLLGQQEG
jgi:hypothetical protein